MTSDGVYLYGYYGQGNLGDDLLLESALRMIRAVRPRAPVFVHCLDPARLPALGDPDIIPVPAAARLADRSRPRLARLMAYRRDLAAAFARCDAFVFGGGTVFQDASSPVSLLLIAATAAMAKRRGLKIAAIGAGVGRLRTAPGRWAMRAVLARADAFCARDAASEAACRALSPNAPIQLTADLAYALPARMAPPATRRGVALTIQPAATGLGDAAGDRARQALRAVISDAVGRNEACALLAFETKQAAGLDDAAAWREIADDLIGAHSALLTVRTFGSGAEALAALEGYRLHVGMRYHGHVLAAIAGAPFAGLAHDVKVEEACRSFAMPCVTLADVSAESLRAAVAAAETRSVDSGVLADLRQRAERNADAVRAVLGSAE